MTASARSKRSFTVGSVVLATLLGFASTSPVLDSIVYDAAPHTCAPHQCSQDAQIIEAYNVGKIYEYDYVVDSIAEMRSASPSKESKLNMAARVKVQVLTPCEFSVKVTNVVMNGKTEVSTMNQELSRFPSEFVLEDRQVQRVCSHPQEPEWVTNIKKGVISSFQSTILPEGTSLGFNVTETDVVGVCETEYLPTRVNGDYQTYQKTKHMDTCQHNQELFQYALNLPDMNIQNLPLMRSEHSCQVTVFGDGRMESSDCTETHVFQPFSSASSGAVATVRRQVKLAGQPTPASSTQRMAETRESSLIFVHQEKKDQASNDQAKLVLELLNSFKSADEASRPEMFSQLVHSMRQLSHSQLLNIFYNGITDPEMRIVALDAIPLLKTEAGIVLMKDIVESGELPRQTLDIWMATLPFYKNPTRGMLGIVSNFIRGEQPMSSALLGVSSLVSSYCKENTECQDLPEVQAIITQYEELLGSNCAAIDSAEEDKVILALKALKTIGHLRRGHAVVEKCYTDSTNSMFVRLAAVDTIKKINCGQDEYDFKKQLFATFSDATADSELRIGAYLALMNCPSQSMVNLVKSVLVNEPVNQVGSFVWTHLTNLQESQSLSEHKKALKTLIGRDFLQNKWRTDVRKFSRYFESSYYAKELNVGATTDGQIIFSQDSYLPRSGMLNLTANIFGENIHLLEIGSRVEGFEGIFEDLFGPDGYFREDSLHKLLQSLRQKRSNQDVSGTISGFQQTYNQDITDASPRGNMYMKMFGRDLHYASFDGLNSLLTKVSPVSLFGSSSPDLDFSRSSIFLDGKIVVPTLAGFPLDLDVNGTSAVSLKSQNKFDLSNLFRSGDANLEVKLYPTATLQISATMTIDAKHNQAGLKSLSKLHTSTYLDGEARMEGGKLMKARLNVPKKTVDILDVSVDFFSMNEQGSYEALTSENEAVDYAGCTPSAFNRAIGMKLCGSALYHHDPQNDLLFAGPLKMKIGLEKVDTFDKYTFEYQRIPASSDGITKMFANWDTPGSSINRLSKINLALDEATLNFVKVDMEIPVSQIKINALYRWTDADKVIKASVAMENENLLSLRQSIQRTEEGKYNAIVRATYKKFDIINLTGTFIATEKKMDIKTSLKSGYLAREIVAQGSLVNTNDQWDIDGKIKSNWINVDVKGLFIQTDTSFDFKSDLRYSGQGYNQAIKVQSAYKADTSGQLDKHIFSVQFDPSNLPEWNTALRWELVAADNYLENEIKIKFGRHTYELEQLFSSQANMENQELLFALGFKAPDRGIAHKIAFEHRNDAYEKANRITLMLPGLIEFETYVDYLEQIDLGSRKLKAGLTYGEIELAAATDLTLRPDLSGMDGQALVRWGQINDPNANIKADFAINQRTRDAVDFGLVGNLVIPNFSPMKTEGSLKVEPGVSVVVEIKANHGQNQFVTAVEAKKIGTTGGKISATFKATGIDYSLNIMMRNDAVKSIHAVLDLGQKYELNAVAKRNFRDLIFDLTYGTKATDRVLFSAKLAPNKLAADLKMLGNEARVRLERAANKVKAEGAFNQDKMTIGVEYQLLPGDYFVNVDLTSTLASIRDVKLNLIHKLKKQPTIELHSMVKLVWNAKTHSLEVKAEKDTTKALIVVETKSAYAALNDMLMKVESVLADKRRTTNVLLKYKEDAIKVSTVIDNGKPKEGLIAIETPWENVREMTLGFLFNYGQEVQIDTYCTWNHAPMATANVTGLVKRNEIDLTFHVTQTRLGEAKAGVSYKNTQRGLSSHIEMNYGVNTVKLSGEYTADQGNGKTGIVNVFVDTTIVKANGVVQVIGNDARKLHVESHLDIANTRYFQMKLDTNVVSLVDHRVEAKIQVTPYEVALTASNNKGVEAFYNMKLTKSKKEVSNVEVTVDNKPESKHAKVTFGILKQVTSVEVKHETKGNTEYVSFVRVQSQEKVFLLQHDTKLTGDLHFVSNVELKTPYEYMKRASSLVDITIKPTELKAQATATFNEETLAVNLNGAIRLDNYQLKAVDLTGALDGFLGKMSCDVKFKKEAGKVFAAGTLNLPNHKPFKVTFSLKKIVGGAEILVDVDAVAPFKLEGSFSRPTPTHFKETFALTFKQELMFRAISELEFEALTDFKATGIVDMPLHSTKPIEFSVLLKKEQAKIVADMEVKKVMKLDAVAQWTGKKVMTTTKMALLGNNYAIVVKGEMSGALKHFETSFTKNSKVWKVETTLNNDGVHMALEGIVKTPDFQHRIEAKLDIDAKGVSVVYQFAGQEAKLTGNFLREGPRAWTINAELNNNFFEALAVAKIDGKFDANDLTDVTIILEATANDDHYLKVNGNMKETTGHVEISAHCPLVKITNFVAKADYKISNKEGQATLTVGDVKKVDLSWTVTKDLAKVHLITPFNSIREVLVLAKRDVTYNGPTKVNFEIDVNQERIITLEGQLERRAIAMKLTTKYPNWRHVEIALNLNGLTDFHLAAVYNNVFEARLLTHLTAQAGKVAAKLKIPLHMAEAGYIASMEYDLTQHKEFKMILQSNQWKNTLVGHIKSNEAMIAMEVGSEQVFITEMTYDGVQRYAGTVELTTKAVFLTYPINVLTKFDVAGTQKTVDVTMSVSGHTVGANLKFKMTHDTFDGVMKCTSDIAGFEAATIKARYNIATEPTAKIQIERNGKVNFIETKLKFDNVIPTVQIKTSFPNFEKMTFTGNYNGGEKGHKQLDLALSRNDENIFVFALGIKPSGNWKDADIVLTILTPITNWKTLNMELGWKSQRDPYGLKIKLQKGQDEISFNGKVSYIEGEFSLKLVTPFEGYESIGLSGKLGTTSLGKHMGISFDNSAVKRDVSMMMNDVGSFMDFNFENQGKEDFAFGLKYDFSRGLSNGEVLAKMIRNPNNAIDLETKLEWNNLDGNFANGFDGLFYLNYYGEQLAYVKAERCVKQGTGHTTLDVKTTIPGYQNLKMELKSDYATKVFASVELGRIGDYSVSVDKVSTGYTVLVKTPFGGYEKLKAEIGIKSQGTVVSVRVLRNDVELGKITANVNADLRAPSVHVKFTGPSNLWAEVKVAYENGRLHLFWKSPKHNGDISMEYKNDGTTTSTKFNIVVDGKHLKYLAERVWTQGKITGNSLFDTNLDWFLEKKVETNYEIKYPATYKPTAGPWEIYYQKKANGVETVLIKLTLTPSNAGKKFKLTGLVKAPEYLADTIEGEAEAERKPTGLALKLRYKTTEAKVELEYSPKSGSVVFTSNIPTFEKMIAQTAWTLDNKKFRGDLKLQRNTNVLLDTKVAVDFQPFTHLKFSVHFTKSEYQELEIRWNNFANGEGKLSVEGEGFLKLKVNVRMAADPNTEDVLELKMDIPQLSDYTPIFIKFGLKVPRFHNKIGFNFDISTKTEKANFVLDTPELDLNNYKAKVNLKFADKNGDKHVAVLTVDVPARKFSVEYNLRTNGVMNKEFEMTGVLNWTPKAADVVVKAIIGGSKKIEFVAKRQGFSHIDYKLEIFGGKMTFLNDNDIRGYVGDVKATLTINPKLAKMIGIGTNEQKIELGVKSTNPGGVRTTDGTLALNGRAYKINVVTIPAEQRFKLSLGPASGANLFVAELKNKDDGRVLTLQITGKSLQIYEDLSRRALGDLSRPVNIKMTENLQHTQLNFRLDVQGKTLKLKAGRGSKFVQVTGNAKNAGNNKYIVLLEGATDAHPQLFNIKAVAVYPLQWNVEVSFKQTTKIVVKANAAKDLTELTSSFEIIRSGNRFFRWNMNAVNKADAKSIEMELDGAKSAKINAQWKKVGELKLDLNSEFAVVNFALNWDVDNAKMNLKINQQRLVLSFGRKPAGFFFNAKHTPSNSFVEAELDAGTFKFNSKIAGKEVKMNVEYSATYINIEVIEPFTNAAKHTLTASFKQSKQVGGGFVVSVKGNLNTVEFEMSAKYAEKRVKFSITSNIAMLKKLALNAKLEGGNKVGEFDLQYTGLKSGWFTVTADLKQPKMSLSTSFGDAFNLAFELAPEGDAIKIEISDKIAGRKLSMVTKISGTSVNVEMNDSKTNTKIVLNGLFKKIAGSSVEFNASGKVNNIGAKVTGKWSKEFIRFVVTSDMAWLKNFDLEMNLPQYKVDFQSNINGKVLKLSGKIINLKEVQIAINEPYMGVGKITLNGKLEKSSDGIEVGVNIGFGATSIKSRFEWTRDEFEIKVESNGSLVRKAEFDVDLLDNGFGLEIAFVGSGHDYLLKGTFGLSGLTVFVKNAGSEVFKAEIELAKAGVGKSLTMLVTGSQIETYKISAKYALADKYVSVRVHAQVPPFSNSIDANLEVGYDFPRKMTFKTKLSRDGDVLVNVDAVIGAAQDFSDIRLTAKFTSAPLSVPKEVGVKIVYRLVAANDFDLQAEVLTPAHTFKAGATLKIGNNKFDCEFKFANGKKEYSTKFGGLFDPSGITIKAYLNNFRFEFDNDQTRDWADNLKIVWERKNLDGEVDPIFALLFPFGDSFVFDVKSNIPGSQPAMVVDAIYTVGTETTHLRAHMKYDAVKQVKGGYFLKYVGKPSRYTDKSAEIEINFGEEGGIEIVIGGVQKHQMTLQWPTEHNRVTRAIFDSPSYGHYEFLTGQDVNSAIVVLSTGHGIHKFAYQIHDEDKFELTVTLESSLISQGHPLTFHLLLDPVSETYSAKITLDEQSFLSVSLGLDIKDIQATFTLQWPRFLTHKIEGQARLKNTAQLLSCELSLTVNDLKHTIKFVFRKVETSFVFAVRSPLLAKYNLGNEWSVEGSATVSEGSHKITAVANIANEKIQLQGQIDHHSLTNFGGKFVYQGTSSILAKANVDFKVLLDLERETIVKLEVTSTHPALPRVKVLMSMDGNTNGYNGNFVAVLPKVDQIEASFRVDSKQWLTNGLNITASTLKHRVSADLTWDWTQGVIEGVVLGPGASDKWVVKTKITTETMTMTFETTRRGIDKVDLLVKWDPESSCEGGNGRFVMKLLGKELDGEIMYNMRPDAKYILASLNTPFHNHEAYELQFGYEDSAKQKQAKAHLTTPRGQLGFLVDFYINALEDFLFLVEIDLPIPELKLTKIKLGHTLKEDLRSLALGAETKNFVINVDYRLKSDVEGTTLLDIEARYNKNNVVLKSYANVEEMKFDIVLKAITQWGKLEIPLSFTATRSLKLNVIVNDVTHVVLKKSKTTGTVSLEVRDIYVPSAFKLALTHDEAQGSVSCTLEMVWDTTNAAETTEIMSMSWRRTETSIEFGSQITWRHSHDTDAITGKIDRTHGQLQVTLSVLHNNRRDWGLDMSSQFEYQGQDIDHTKKLTIVVPSHAIEYDLHQRERSDISHCDASLKWSQRDGPKYGLEYVYDVQKLNHDGYSYTLVVRQIGQQVQTFSSRYQTGRGSQSVSVDINHSHDLTRSINLEASLDSSNSNAQRTTVKVKSSYTFGAMPTQRNDLTVSVDEEQFLMEFADSNNIYTLHGKKAQQGVMQVTLAVNGQQFSRLFVTIQNDKPLMNADLKYAEHTIRVSGGLKESNVIEFIVETQRKGESAVVQLDTSLVLSSDGRVLEAKFDYRPEMIEETHQALGVLKTKMLTTTQQALPHVSQHAAHLEKVVKLTIDETAKQIKEILDVDITQYVYVYETLKENIESLYINSLPVVKVVVSHATKMLSFYVKEINALAQKTMTVAKSFIDIAQEVANDAVDFVFVHFEGTWEFIKEVRSAIIDELAQLEVGDFNARDYVKVTVKFVRATLEKVTEVYKKWSEYLSLLPVELSGEIEADIARFLEDLSQFLKKFKTFNKVVGLYYDYQSWFEEFHLSQRIEDVTSDFRSQLVDIARQLSEIKASILKYWNSVQGKINGTISDYPLLAYGVSVGKKVLKMTKKVVDHMSIEHNMKVWVRKIIGRADAVASTLIRLIDVIYHEKDLIKYDFNYDLSAGTIVYRQVMPFQWYSFQDTPDIMKVADLVGLKGSSAEAGIESLDLKALQHDLLEAIDVITAALHTKSIIPPFSATGLVAGDSHIITYDQTYYNFAGSEGCSYLLTSDFSHGRFSAIANYDADMRRTSIDIVSDGHTISIETKPSADGLIKVTLDKRNSQLPIQFDHTYAYREENTIVVENSEGLKVSCNTVYNVCTFTISGWYFGKTGGLLGIYDNEPSNDWMTSDREIVTSLEDFVNSWSVTHDRQCPVRFFSNNPAQPTLEEAQACESVFSSTESALMPCYSTIDPAPYMKMCLRDMQTMKNRADKQAGVCSSAAAYIKQCQQAGVELWMPGHCVRCNINSQETMANGESTRIQGNTPQSADVVFIVQKSSCLRDLELHDLPMLVDRSLTNKGLTDNRYALVSFAGKDNLQRPHIFTSGSQIFNDVTRMKTALDHLSNMPSDESVGDIFEALQFAARLNLRAGVVKTFVLVRCDASESMTSRAYGDSMTMLLEQGISLHVMMPLEMRLKGSTTKLTSKMFGFSKDSVITASSLDKDLRRQLKDPKDQVSTLAQESGGVVFDLNRLKSRKRTMAKKASTMMGKALAQLSKPLDCEVCDCLADADGKGRVMCHRCVLPSIDIVLQNLEMMLNQ